MEISDRPTKEEIDIMSSLIKQDSMKGHYDKSFTELSFCQSYFSHIDKTCQIPGYPGSGLLMVFRENDKAVCFSVVCSSPLPEFDCEILFFSTLSQHRRKGFGQAAIRLILEEVKGKSVIARCLPKSKAMAQLLNETGFKRFQFGESINLNFVHQNK